MKEGKIRLTRFSECGTAVDYGFREPAIDAYGNEILQDKLVICADAVRFLLFEDLNKRGVWKKDLPEDIILIASTRQHGKGVGIKRNMFHPQIVTFTAKDNYRKYQRLVTDIWVYEGFMWFLNNTFGDNWKKCYLTVEEAN